MALDNFKCNYLTPLHFTVKPASRNRSRKRRKVEQENVQAVPSQAYNVGAARSTTSVIIACFVHGKYAVFPLA